MRDSEEFAAVLEAQGSDNVLAFLVNVSLNFRTRTSPV